MNETTNFKEKLNEKLLDLLSSSIDERKKAYLNNEIVDIPKDVEQIYKKIANKNSAISGASGLVPGPFGMALALPEIALILKNQINMVYDISKKLGKEKQISKELILGILLSSAGATSIGILTVQGSKVIVKGASLSILKKVVAMLGGRILKAQANSMIAKWVPIAGALAMAAWSRYSTMEIGKYAVSVFNKDIETTNDEIDDIKIEEVNETEVNQKFESSIHLEKAKILINLLNIDRHIDENEIKFIKDLISKSDISQNEKKNLIEDFSKSKVYDIDFSFFKNSHMESTGMLMDMIALIQSDEKLHFSEKIYFKKVAEEIGIEKDEVEELLTELKPKI